MTHPVRVHGDEMWSWFPPLDRLLGRLAAPLLRAGNRSMISGIRKILPSA